jgi:glycine dehydrogenase
VGLGRAILTISVGVHRADGREGLKRATEVAILNANYMAKRLEKHFRCCTPGPTAGARTSSSSTAALREVGGIKAEDIAKRLMDYGFHAPTMSFPVRAR